ncbi:MAG: class I SAM-dependent methyltransferase [Bacteroidota bacterium]
MHRSTFMMTPHEIGEAYSRMAQHWLTDTNSSSYGLKLVDRAISYCENRQTALDVGCGSGGRIINELLAHQFLIQGVDVAAKMISLAREQHPSVVFHCADIVKWQIPGKYDLIIAWDSLFHLPIDAHESVLYKLCSHLVDGGIMLYTFGEGYGIRKGSFAGETFTYSTIGINNNLKVIREAGCKCQHLELDQYPQNHVSIIIKKSHP